MLVSKLYSSISSKLSIGQFIELFSKDDLDLESHDTKFLTQLNFFKKQHFNQVLVAEPQNFFHKHQILQFLRDNKQICVFSKDLQMFTQICWQRMDPEHVSVLEIFLMAQNFQKKPSISSLIDFLRHGCPKQIRLNNDYLNYKDYQYHELINILDDPEKILLTQILNSKDNQDIIQALKSHKNFPTDLLQTMQTIEILANGHQELSLLWCLEFMPKTVSFFNINQFIEIQDFNMKPKLKSKSTAPCMFYNFPNAASIISNTKRNTSCVATISSGTYAPKALSATAIELLMQNPYGFYAKYILKLKNQPWFEQLSAKDFGILTHKCLENMMKQGKSAATMHLTNGTPYPVHWQRKIMKILDWVAQRMASISHNTPVAEIKKSIILQLKNNQQLCIEARCDSILETEAGLLVINFKTATPPSKTDVLNGFYPQLIIEDFVQNTPHSQAEFWHLKGTQPVGLIVNFAFNKQEIQQNIEKIINYYFASQKTKFFACPWPLKKPKYDHYLHFARL